MASDYNHLDDLPMQIKGNLLSPVSSHISLVTATPSPNLVHNRDFPSHPNSGVAGRRFESLHGGAVALRELSPYLTTSTGQSRQRFHRGSEGKASSSS